MFNKIQILVDRIEGDFNISKAAWIIGVCTILTKFASLLKANLFASRFAASSQADIYFASFRIPDFVFNLLILGTLSVAFIPIFTQARLKEKKEAEKLANTVLNFAVIFIGIVLIVCYWAMPHLAKLVVPGFSEENLTSTIRFSRMLLLSPIIFTVSNVVSSILTSYRRFLIVSLAPLFYNLGIILGILVFYPAFGFYGLAWGVIFGAVLHLTIQLPELFKVGFRYRPVVSIRSKLFKQFGKLFIPRLFAFDGANVSLLIAAVLGSRLAEGSIAVFNYAFDLQSVPLGIFAFSTAAAAFPALSDAYARKSQSEFTEILGKSFIRVLFYIIPTTVAILILRAQLVRILLGHGQFGWQETILTFNALGIFSLSLGAQALIPLLSRGFYARHNTSIPVILSVFSIIFNALIAYFLYSSRGVIGIVIGFSISSAIQCVSLFLILRFYFLQKETAKNILHEFDLRIVSGITRLTISSGITGVALYGTLYAADRFVPTNNTLGLLVQAGLSVVVGTVVFLGTALLLRLDEAGKFVKGLRRFLLPWQRNG